LDEPTAGIDAVAEENILGLLDDLHRGSRLAILMVSHNLGSLRHHVERVFLIRIIGSPSDCRGVAGSQPHHRESERNAVSEFARIFSPHFLLHNALWGSIAVGLFCPLIGSILCCAAWFFSASPCRKFPAPESPSPSSSRARRELVASCDRGKRPLPGAGGSLLFTTAAILVLAYLERRGEGTAESRIGASYALAYAAAILFVATNATGKIEMLGMLHGEIVA